MKNALERKNGHCIETITARSGLTNPLHTYKSGLDMSIQAEQV